MKNFTTKTKTFSSSDNLSTMVVKYKDDGSLSKLMNAIKGLGNGGHSFSIVVDPEDENMSIGWDGDGADRIESINIQHSS